jgi:predicted dehydrogenase
VKSTLSSLASCVLLVLVDKPATSTVAEAQELASIAQSKSLVLTAFQNRRWDADFLALRRLINLPPSDPKSLGDIHEFESQSVQLVL